MIRSLLKVGGTHPKQPPNIFLVCFFVFLLAISLTSCTPFSNAVDANWKARLNVKNSFYPPLFSDKLIIIAGTEARFGEPNTGLVTALDATDGKTIWKFKPERGIEAPPIVRGGIVYVTNADYFGTMKGGVYALGAASGKELWRFDGGGVWATPLIIKDTVYFGSDDSNFYAAGAKDGKVRWRFATPDPLLVGAIAADQLIILSSSTQTAGSLIALDQDGKEAWRFPTGRRVNYPATADGDMVYFGNGGTKKEGAKGTFYGLKAQTGEKVWSFEGNSPDAAPVIAGGLVLFSTLDPDDRINLYALDKLTGKKRWKLKSETGSGAVRSEPVVAADTTYLAADKLLSIKTINGNVDWRFDLGGVETFAPIVDDGAIYYAASEEGGEKAIEKENAADPELNLYAIDPKTGKPVWRFTRQGEVGDFAVKNGVVYVVTREGLVYSVGGK